MFEDPCALWVLNSANPVKQKATVEKKIRRLEDETTKAKTERTDDAAALQKRVLPLENKMTKKNTELSERPESEDTSGIVRAHGV